MTVKSVTVVAALGAAALASVLVTSTASAQDFNRRCAFGQQVSAIAEGAGFSERAGQRGRRIALRRLPASLQSNAEGRLRRVAQQRCGTRDFDLRITHITATTPRCERINLRANGAVLRTVCRRRNVFVSGFVTNARPD